MSLSRRSIILAAGGTLALVGTGALYRVNRLPQTASRPWEIDAPFPADVRLDAFRHAILAPNPHNRQPWQIKLVGTDEALLSCDLSRRLPQTDPYDRQITIGFGCFLALAELAAQSRGFRLDVIPFPDGEPLQRLDQRPVAKLKFVAVDGLKADPLFSAALNRRSTKLPFDMKRPVPESTHREITDAVGPDVQFGRTLLGNPQQTQNLRDLVWKAWKIEAETERTWQETVDLMRIGAAEVDAQPDGVSLRGPMIEGLSMLGMIDRKTMADTKSTAFQTGFKRYEAMMTATPAFVWISTASNTRKDQLASGRAYLRMNLAATRAGVAIHPVSQCLQEFPEMQNAKSDLQKILARDHVQMLARIGYAEVIGPTPRWPLEAKLMA